MPHGAGPRMGSKYPRSMQCFLPLWTLVLEVALIVIFFFFTSYDTSSQDPKKLMETYRGECPEGRWSQRQAAGTREEEVRDPPGT